MSNFRYEFTDINDGVIAEIFIEPEPGKPDRNYKLNLKNPPSSDVYAFYHLFKRQEYKPLIELIQGDNKVKGPFQILDIGGNIGLFSIYFHCFFPDSKFIIIEPFENNFNPMKSNIQQNGFINAELVFGGAWNKEAYLKTVKDFRDEKDWATRVVESEEQTEIKGFTIIKLMEKFEHEFIDVLKIDVEGAEKYLFADIKEASEFLSKTKYIAIEIHDEFDCRREIYNCLKRNHFEFFEKNEVTFGKNKKLVR